MLSYRKFDKESDYYIMRSIVQSNCLQTGQLYPQIHIGNLDFDRYACEESPNISYKKNWIVSDSKTEIGFITAEEDGFFFLTILLKFKHFTPEIIDYIEHNCYMKGDTITVGANSKDILLSSILQQKGYTKTNNSRYHGICNLSKIPSYSPLQKGLSIGVSQENDVARRVELFGLATGGMTTTSKRYKSLMKSPSYCDAIDLVVHTDNEEIIAYCTIWRDFISKIAILEPVACVEEYRRKGIMKSTLLYGMNLCKQSENNYIYVGTGGNNMVSQALYKSVGFLEYGREYEWQKTL